MAIVHVASDHFPYLPLTISVAGRTAAVEALIDTGFDGDIVVPRAILASGPPPDEFRNWELADGSVVVTPIHYGTVQLGSFDRLEADIALLGEEPIVGRGVTDHFRLVLDHGEQVIAEP